MSGGAPTPARAVSRAERACLVALASLPRIGPATLLACDRTVGAEVAWAALRSGTAHQIAVLAAADARTRSLPRARPLLPDLQCSAAALEPEAVLARQEAAGHRVLVFGEADYPLRLGDDPAPPAVLFVEGSLEPLDGPVVAIVGTRNATRLGCETAADLARGLARCGVSVVSGLALGIDGAAHGAMVGEQLTDPASGQGRPIGVIATGLDRPYPRRHAVLHRQVAARGALVSESPLGGTPLPWRFPARNRTIAGLADAVVVVESRSAGGSMLTAAEALARDVPVLAVPGHPTAGAAAGPLDLIADGAAPVRDLEDVLVAIGLGGRSRRSTPGSVSSAPLASPGEEAVLAELVAAPRSLGELVLATALDLDALSDVLLRLEHRGLVARSGMWFEATRGPCAKAGKGSER